jgi:hypothetical protein
LNFPYLQNWTTPIYKVDLQTLPAVSAASYQLIDHLGGIMGPYYRGTSQSTGAFFDMFYQHPILILVLVVAIIGAGFFLMRGKKSE